MKKERMNICSTDPLERESHMDQLTDVLFAQTAHTAHYCIVFQHILEHEMPQLPDSSLTANDFQAVCVYCTLAVPESTVRNA